MTLAGGYQPKGYAELTLGELHPMRSRALARALTMAGDTPTRDIQKLVARTDLSYHRRYAMPLASHGAIVCALYYGLLVAGDVATPDG